MASIDSLPGDQRAVLELVLRRGRSYDEIAQLLSIDRAGVRERALSALDALGPDAAVPAERRALITDYLLGALPPRVTEQVRDRLAQSPSERAWARVIASELEPIASRPLPEIPAGSSPPGLQGEPTEQAPALGAEKPAEPDLGTAGPAPEGRRRGPIPREPRQRGRGSPGPGSRLWPGKERSSSRRGGMVVLAGAAVIVVGVVLALTLTGGSSPTRSASHTSTGSTTPAGTSTSGQSTTGTTPTTGTTTATPHILGQINLNPPSGGSAKGIAEVLREGNKNGVAIVAQGLKPNTKHDAYAVWLYNSQTDNHLLGFVSPPVTSNGKLQTAGGLPTNAAHFKKLIVTLETNGSPKAPGTVILQGPVAGLS